MGLFSEIMAQIGDRREHKGADEIDRGDGPITDGGRIGGSDPISDTGDGVNIRTVVKGLFGGTLTIEGINFFTDGPQDFILVVLYQEIVDIVTQASGEAALMIVQLNQIFLDSTVGVLDEAVGQPFAYLGDSVISLVDIVDQIAVSVASSAGPLGIIVIPLVWAAAIVALGGVLVGVWRAYLLIRSAIV